MGRIRSEITIDGSTFWLLFDSGARNTYVTPEVAKYLATRSVPPREAALGGKRHAIGQACILIGSIEGKTIDTDGYVIDEIGTDEDGRPIEVLLGALAMQKWGIRLIPEDERVDWSHYPREFVEF